MKLYNSLSKQVEELTTIIKGEVSIYSCGPTVYNNLHIGNLSAFIYADLLRRTLAVSDYKVNHVMNITDVDDKTIRDSKRDYPDDKPMAALSKLTTTYTKIFMNDLIATGNDVDAMTFISAVDTIQEMIELTQRIIDAGYGYAAEDGIYFSVSAYMKAGNDYGLLQKLDFNHTRQRVNNDEYDKEAASDFALWKKSGDDEPSWEAHFTVGGMVMIIAGRPGWHIECSAMSEKLLGVPFDIHTGGVDLKFPHHENEIAQTRAGDNAKLAHYFVHNNHILVDGKKMSKSLGNFYTLRDIEKKGYSADAFRILVLEGNYRNESNFSWDILDAAQRRLEDIEAWADLRFQPSADKMTAELDEKFKETKDNMLTAMQDDLNTPQALAALSGLMNHMAKITIPGVEGQHTDGTLQFIDDLLGLRLQNRIDITEEQKKLLEERQKARKDKNWQESDRIRDALAEQGLEISDSFRGQNWRRIRKD